LGHKRLRGGGKVKKKRKRGEKEKGKKREKIEKKVRNKKISKKKKKYGKAGFATLLFSPLSFRTTVLTHYTTSGC